jgi:hypothetical protein
VNKYINEPQRGTETSIKAIISLNIINHLIFVMGVGCIFFETGTEVLYIIQMSFGFRGLMHCIAALLKFEGYPYLSCIFNIYVHPELFCWMLMNSIHKKIVVF